jgi:predicted RNase H-like nuclease (RuvC/YqgF family)
MLTFLQNIQKYSEETEYLKDRLKQQENKLDQLYRFHLEMKEEMSEKAEKQQLLIQMLQNNIKGLKETNS